MNRRTFTLYEKQVIYAKCNGKCAICGKPVKFKKMTIDHFDFDQGATTDPEEAMVFAYNRGNMWTQLEISRDYILEIKKLESELEALG